MGVAVVALVGVVVALVGVVVVAIDGCYCHCTCLGVVIGFLSANNSPLPWSSVQLAEQNHFDTVGSQKCSNLHEDHSLADLVLSAVYPPKATKPEV